MLTVKQLQEMLSDLQNSYNKYQNNMPNLGMYSIDVQRKKTEDYRNTGFEVYQKEFLSLDEKINNAAKVLKKNINQLKFPLRSSENVNERILHEQKSMNAKMFYNQFKNNNEMILSELKDAKLSHDYDYLNSLLDVYFASHVNLKENPGEDREDLIYKGIYAFREQYYTDTKIDLLTQDINELNKISLLVNSFVQALTEGTLVLYTPHYFDSLSDDEYYNLKQKISDSFGETEYQKIENFSRIGI